MGLQRIKPQLVKLLYKIGVIKTQTDRSTKTVSRTSSSRVRTNVTSRYVRRPSSDVELPSLVTVTVVYPSRRHGSNYPQRFLRCEGSTRSLGNPHVLKVSVDLYHRVYKLYLFLPFEWYHSFPFRFLYLHWCKPLDQTGYLTKLDVLYLIQKHTSNIFHISLYRIL